MNQDSQNTTPQNIKSLLDRRKSLRQDNKFQEADLVREQIESQGYRVVDLPDQSIIEPQANVSINTLKNTGPSSGKIAIFGSGELSTIGRGVHEFLIKDCIPPVKIALLETPAGYEDNPHHWYRKLEKMLLIGLQNYKPQISLVEALRCDGENSTNNDKLLQPLLEANYIHTGAGSPSYAAKHLRNSLALSYMQKRFAQGVSLSVASAAAIAFSQYLLPVYELYFAGEDPHWQEGLDFFGNWGLDLTVIPHWNNTEGGKDIDTRFAYMGEKRFAKLLALLPAPTMVLGIDEHTACILDPTQKKAQVAGKGGVTIFSSQNTQNKKIFQPSQIFSFKELQI